jgi:hypothetical protein
MRHAGLERAKLELDIVESQLRLRSSPEHGEEELPAAA